LNAPGASAQLGGDVEPTGGTPTADQATSLSKLLAELQSSSRLASSVEAAAGELSLQLRTAFHYLEELVRQVIHASPPFTVKLDLIYLGALPAASLANGTVACTMKTLGDAEVVDTVTLAYRMTSSSKARIVLNRSEAAVLKAQLER